MVKDVAAVQDVDRYSAFIAFKINTGNQLFRDESMISWIRWQILVVPNQKIPTPIPIYLQEYAVLSPQILSDTKNYPNFFQPSVSHF